MLPIQIQFSKPVNGVGQGCMYKVTVHAVVVDLTPVEKVVPLENRVHMGILSSLSFLTRCGELRLLVSVSF